MDRHLQRDRRDRRHRRPRFGTGANAFGTGLTFTAATVANKVVDGVIGVDRFLDIGQMASQVEAALFDTGYGGGVASTAATAQIYEIVVNGIGDRWLILNDDNATLDVNDTFICITGSTPFVIVADIQFV